MATSRDELVAAARQVMAGLDFHKVAQKIYETSEGGLTLLGAQDFLERVLSDEKAKKRAPRFSREGPIRASSAIVPSLRGSEPTSPGRLARVRRIARELAQRATGLVNGEFQGLPAQKAITFTYARPSPNGLQSWFSTVEQGPYLRLRSGPEIVDLMRIERGKRQAHFAAEAVDWGDLTEVVASAYGHAQAYRGQDAQSQIGAYEKVRDQALDTIDPTDERKAAAALVACATGWVEGSDSAELYKQLYANPSMSMGMPADIQAIVDIARLNGKAPEYLLEMAKNERVVVTMPAPNQLNIELLPETQPVIQICKVNHSSDQWSDVLSGEEVRKQMSELNQSPGLYKQEIVSAGLVARQITQGQGKANNRFMCALNKEVRACYPPITASGEVIRQAPQRILEITHPYDLDSRLRNELMVLARAAIKDPNQAILYTPDGENYRAASECSQVLNTTGRMKYTPRSKSTSGGHDALIADAHARQLPPQLTQRASLAALSPNPYFHRKTSSEEAPYTR